MSAEVAKPSKGEETRALILEAAVQHAGVHGFDALTIGLLAEQTGLSKSGLFAHFGSKEELQIATLNEAVRRYNEGGAGGVKNKSKNQASKTLTAEQVKELEALIESGKTDEQRLWSGAQIKRWVLVRTGREIHKTTAWRMFGRLEFTRQTPRPQHSRRAGEAEQADFKKT